MLAKAFFMIADMSRVEDFPVGRNTGVKKFHKFV